MNQKGLVHPSSFILHPSSFILHPFYCPSGTHINSFSSRRNTRPSDSAGCAHVGPHTFDFASSLYPSGFGSISVRLPLSSSIKSLSSAVRSIAAWYFAIFSCFHFSLPV